MKKLSSTINLLKQARVELINSKVLTDKEQLALHEQINTVVDEIEKHYQECVESYNNTANYITTVLDTINQWAGDEIKNCIECGTLIPADGSGWCDDCHPAYGENRKYRNGLPDYITTPFTGRIEISHPTELN
jgi:hypothetical protein